MSGQGLSSDQLIRSQAAEVIRLTKEKRVLKAALARQTIEAGKSFREMQDQFDELAKQIYDVICHWVAVLQRPLTYDAIIEKYRKRYPNPPFVNYTAETITRRVRELKQDGFLHSPEQGSFVPVKKEEAQT